MSAPDLLTRAAEAERLGALEVAESNRIPRPMEQRDLGRATLELGPMILLLGSLSTATAELSRALVRLRELIAIWKTGGEGSETVKHDLDVQIGVVEEGTSKVRGIRLKYRGSRTIRR